MDTDHGSCMDSGHWDKAHWASSLAEARTWVMEGAVDWGTVVCWSTGSKALVNHTEADKTLKINFLNLHGKIIYQCPTEACIICTLFYFVILIFTVVYKITINTGNKIYFYHILRSKNYIHAI